jgi:hypothetical protein
MSVYEMACSKAFTQVVRLQTCQQKVRSRRNALSWTSLCRPFARANTFKPAAQALHRRVFLLNYRPMRWGAELEMRQHPTIHGFRRAI